MIIILYRHVEYKLTSLEKSYKYEHLTDHNLGVCIDLVNKNICKNDDNSQIENADEKLLEEDIVELHNSNR